MQESAPLDPSTLEVLGRVREVRVETTSPDGNRTHRTIVWIVTAGEHAYVRSVNGTPARWYREALGRPDVVVHADGAAIPMTAVLANAPESIQAVSNAFRSKYGKISPSSTESMVQPHTLETTIRLDPRGSAT